METSTRTSVAFPSDQPTAAPVHLLGQPTPWPTTTSTPTTSVQTPLSDAIMTINEQGGSSNGFCVFPGGERGQIGTTVLYQSDGSPATITICLPRQTTTTTIHGHVDTPMEMAWGLAVWGFIAVSIIIVAFAVVMIIEKTDVVGLLQEGFFTLLLRAWDRLLVFRDAFRVRFGDP